MKTHPADDREQRTLLPEESELRAEEGEGETPAARLEGYAARFGVLSVDLGGFRERVLPGAFRQSLEQDDIFAVWSHNPSDVLGRNRAQTLELKEDDRGLRVVIHPPRTPLGESRVESVRRRDVDKMSFGFQALEDRWIYDEGELPIRELQRVKLFEVSPTIFPGYPQTTIAARAVAASIALRGLAPDPRLVEPASVAEPELRALIAAKVRVLVKGPEATSPEWRNQALRARLALAELEAAA